MNIIFWIQKIIDSISIFYRALHGIILMVAFYTVLMILYWAEVFGGKLFLPLLTVLGMFTLVYFFYFYISKIRKNWKLVDFISDDVFRLTKKNHRTILLIQLTVIFFIFFMPVFIFTGNYLVLDKEAEIDNIVAGLIDNSMNDTEKVDALLSWFTRYDNGSENFSSVYHREHNDQRLLFFGPIIIYDEEPFFCFRGGSSTDWIITSRCGMCGEHGTLFTEFCNRAGLNVSTIYCKPEDHVWNEVYLDGRKEPLIIDATENNHDISTGYMDSEFMMRKIRGDCKKWGGEKSPEGNISFVYAEFPDDKGKINVTYRYTNTTNITVNITDFKGKPASDIMVKVCSFNRPGKKGIDSWGLEKITNDAGQVTFTLGGGRYSFKLQHRDDWFSITTDIQEFGERNKHHFYDVEYTSKTIIDVIVEHIYWFLSIGLLILLYIVFKLEKRFSSG